MTEREALTYAKDRSTGWRILASSVTRFVVGELGSRHPVAWFVDGREQLQRGVRPGRLYPIASTDGSDADLGDGAANPAGGRQ